MSTMVPMYGFGGGSGKGATLTVTAPAGATVTVSKDGKTKTKVSDSSGAAVFKGLSTGTWTLTITDGEQTAQKTVTVTADYSTAITFFAATIHITYPAGSICTATDGVTTLTAPDTSGTWDCVVPNAGTWTISSTAAQWKEEIPVRDNGQTFDADVTKLYLQKGASINCATAFTNVYTDVLDGIVKYRQNGDTRNCVVNFGPVSLTGATKLFVNVKGGESHPSFMPGFCVSKAILTNVPSSDLKRFEAGDSSPGWMSIKSGNYSMDVSSYSGDYYVALFWAALASNITHVDVESIYSEI